MKRLRRITCATPCTFMRALTIVSITTQRHVTTSLRPSWLGNEPWIFSTNTSGLSDALPRLGHVSSLFIPGEGLLNSDFIRDADSGVANRKISGVASDQEAV